MVGGDPSEFASRLAVLLPFPDDPSITALVPARIYCVGGAVRDALLGRTVRERDWVVVGSTPEAMHRAGFRPVGKDFPVFLHRQSHEEYALARTERKTGWGYHGFQFQCGPGVSLIDDLVRRDLRINAMAVDPEGRLIDPHGGVADLWARRLHHVSEAFREDPVRILRVARFAASLRGFQVHPDTLDLMRAMVRAGETRHWIAERVWRELDRGMGQELPSAMWRCLGEVGAAPFSALGAEHEPWLACIDKAAKAGASGLVRWGIWGALAGPDFRAEVSACARMPREITSIIALSARHLEALLDVLEELAALASGRLRLALQIPGPPFERLVERLGALFAALDVLRRPERLDTLLAIAALHPRLETPGAEQSVQALDTLREAAQSFAAPIVVGLPGQGSEMPAASGPQIASLVRSARLKALGEGLRKRYA